jgi:hypothetical protein
MFFLMLPLPDPRRHPHPRKTTKKRISHKTMTTATPARYVLTIGPSTASIV